MSHYRIYTIGSDGSITAPPRVVECEDDLEAVEKAKQVLSGDMFTNSNLPLIQSGVAAARQAGAASRTSTQGNLATSGVAQSPFAAAIIALFWGRL